VPIANAICRDAALEGDVEAQDHGHLLAYGVPDGVEKLHLIDPDRAPPDVQEVLRHAKDLFLYRVAPDRWRIALHSCGSSRGMTRQQTHHDGATRYERPFGNGDYSDSLMKSKVLS
jgi:hypothetical protein